MVACVHARCSGQVAESVLVLSLLTSSFEGGLKAISHAPYVTIRFMCFLICDTKCPTDFLSTSHHANQIITLKTMRTQTLTLLFCIRGLPIDLTAHLVTLYTTKRMSNHTHFVRGKTLNYERRKTEIPQKTSQCKQN